MPPPDGTINPGSIGSPGLQESSPTKGSAGGGNTGDGGNGGRAGGGGNSGGGGAGGGGNFPGTPLFDPSDPAFFNFDIASLNFGSQYGALEFGVLGRMSGQAADADDGSVGSYAYSPSMGPGEGYGGFSAPQDDSSHFRDGWGASHGGRNSGAGHNVGFAGTYMIEAGPGSLTSPSPPVESPRQNYIQSTAQTTAGSANYDATATSGPMSSPSFYQSGGHHRPSNLQQVQSASTAQQQQQQQQVPQIQAPIRRRRLPEDPSQIYNSITTPYPYTLHYHRLFHMLETRFPKPLLLRIARAMASFRPSFIACTQTLKADDLLFMEKCFQRTLWEYERFIQNCGTPTLVCRRTGEVVGVGKEFCMLTGWEKQVLLGEKANRNTNVPVNGEVVNFQPPSVDEYGLGGVNVATGGGAGSGLGGMKKPVFLAELLDDESVVEFYEQFARLAFGDARGAVMTTCKVLKYRAEKDDSKKDGVREARGMDGLGAKDGKVECAFCWTIKRDVFDIPMLIVANVSFPSFLFQEFFVGGARADEYIVSTDSSETGAGGGEVILLSCFFFPFLYFPSFLFCRVGCGRVVYDSMCLFTALIKYAELTGRSIYSLRPRSGRMECGQCSSCVSFFLPPRPFLHFQFWVFVSCTWTTVRDYRLLGTVFFSFLASFFLSVSSGSEFAS